ncbi:MAG TPA: HAD family hydrolase, partial [Pseudomonadales bacterium]|nr:HAD family hydrolase [Pseudomonadales bacterium]
MSRIVVVTFDLDNTLWDVDEVIRNAERVTRQWFDARVPELYATLTADDFMDIRKGIVAEHPELAHNLSKIRETVFERAIVAVGRAPAEATALAREAFELFLAERHKVSFYDAALDV